MLLIKKILRFVAGLLAASANLAAFGGLAWWVSTENNVMGYIAAALFAIMAVLGAIIVFILIVFDDKTTTVQRHQKGAREEGKLDAGTVAAAMIVANSEQYYDQEDAAEDYAGDDYADDIDID